MSRREITVRVDATDQWPAAKRGLLRDLWAEGLSAAQIGARLGVTKCAVIGMRNRLGLPARRSPIQRGGAPAIAVPRVEMPTHRRVHGGHISLIGHRKDAIEGATLVWDDRPPAWVSAPIPPAKTCQWPSGRKFAVRFCGAPIARGSYCAQHAARAFRSVAAAP